METAAAKRSYKQLYTFILPLLIVLLRPLGMNLNQSIILGALVLVLIWWTTGVVNKTYSSIVLLVVFALFGSTPFNVVFRFPMSSNFYMIGFSFLLSQGIVNSNVANRLSGAILNKYCNHPYKLILMSFIFGTVLIFLIPQPFSRVILLASIYKQFFKGREIGEKGMSVLLFSIFMASTATSMLFLNGDIILNLAALQFGEVSLGWLEWAKYMLLPSIATTLLMGGGFLLLFREDIRSIKINSIKEEKGAAADIKEKAAIVIMGLVILLWMTESIHSVNSAIVALVGTLAMFIFGILEKKDIKSFNISLMIFLTAAFSIGSVMKGSGVADILYARLMTVFPSSFSNLYIMIIIAVVMILHMFLGSSLTTLSVVVPGLIELTKGTLGAIPLVLLAYITVNLHYILPFHHVTIMIGAGNNYYSNRIVAKFGLLMTILVFLVVFGLYLPWWRFIKII